MSEPNLWEILVPCTNNDGRPNRTRKHRVWDQKVRDITGGLTVYPPVKGQWVAADGQLYDERMIPVRILATREQMQVIAEMTAKFYEQLAVLAYRVSNEVIFIDRQDTA